MKYSNDQLINLMKCLKSPPEETIAERVKLMPRKRKRQKIVTGIKILTPNKLRTRLSILLAQIKAVNNSEKLKREFRQILYLLYQHSKITFTTIYQVIQIM